MENVSRRRGLKMTHQNREMMKWTNCLRA
jgi:hypothetical protein